MLVGFSLNTTLNYFILQDVVSLQSRLVDRVLAVDLQEEEEVVHDQEVDHPASPDPDLVATEVAQDHITAVRVHDPDHTIPEADPVQGVIQVIDVDTDVAVSGVVITTEAHITNQDSKIQDLQEAEDIMQETVMTEITEVVVEDRITAEEVVDQEVAINAVVLGIIVIAEITEVAHVIAAGHTVVAEIGIVTIPAEIEEKMKRSTNTQMVRENKSDMKDRCLKERIGMTILLQMKNM